MRRDFISRLRFRARSIRRACSARRRGLTVFNNELIVVGNFSVAGGVISAHWARAVSPCAPGDLDSDDDIDGIDLALLLGQWGPCPPDGPCSADLNFDRIVNGIDLALLLGAWG